ncbi:MAG: acyltransferase [Sediminibacterium sp.]
MKENKLDTLLIIRGLLAVAVVIWHVTSNNNTVPAGISVPGRTAVWFFFGISGYVISYGFFTERYRLNVKDIKVFYLNRFLRIYPLFLFLSLLTLLTEYLVTGQSLISIADIPSQFFMLQFQHEYHLSGVFWTLGIEVQFYLIAPLLILLFTDKSKYLILAAVYILLLAWLPFAFYIFGWSFDGRNLISNLSHFFIGMIGCRFVLDKKTIKINNYILVGSILVIIAITDYLYAHLIRYYWTLGTVLIDMAIFLSICLHANLKGRTVTQKNLLVRIFSFLGIISYGVYAWHPYLVKYIPLLETSVMLAIGVTVLAAFLSYKLLEQPILRLKKNGLKIAAIS